MLQFLKSLDIHQYNCELLDIRIEETNPLDIAFYQNELSNYSAEKKLGAFIRVFADKKWYYLSTTDIAHLETELHKLLRTANISTEKKTERTITYTQNVFENVTDKYTLYIPKEDKIAYIQRYRDILENDELVISPYFMWIDSLLRKYYINNKGIVYSYDSGFSSICCWYALKQDDDVYDTSYFKTFQTGEGLEQIYKDFLEDFAEAKLFIHSPAISPGKYPVVMSPETAGIFAHESFGHKSEADFMLGDPSMKDEWEIGKKVANDIVSIVDWGADPATSGYCPIDDEGNPTQKTYLIKDGVLMGRLHSTETAQILKESITGNARSINFEYEPIVRMTSTYIEKGDLSFDELIAPIKDGYFIKKITHGSGMSTFTIAANRAYKIENGKITDPVKINIITGTVFQTLYDIDGLSDKLEIQSSNIGGCGKNNQFPLMVSDGGPYVRVKSMNIS